MKAEGRSDPAPNLVAEASAGEADGSVTRVYARTISLIALACWVGVFLGSMVVFLPEMGVGFSLFLGVAAACAASPVSLIVGASVAGVMSLASRWLLRRGSVVS